MKHDIIYIVREGGNEELRWSLRSVEKNFPHNHVWIFGGKPTGIAPFYFEPRQQQGEDKFWRVYNTFREVIWDARLTEDIWLFNDDFFVLRRMTRTVPLHRGELRDHIKGIEARHGRPSGYSRRLGLCEKRLREKGLTTLDYALHVPMLIDKAKALETLEAFPDCPMFRSLYGNYAKIGGELYEDVKTVDPDKIIPEDALFFSTSNKSFAGRVREQLEQRFPEPCRYER